MSLGQLGIRDLEDLGFDSPGVGVLGKSLEYGSQLVDYFGYPAMSLGLHKIPACFRTTWDNTTPRGVPCLSRWRHVLRLHFTWSVYLVGVTFFIFTSPELQLHRQKNIRKMSLQLQYYAVFRTEFLIFILYIKWGGIVTAHHHRMTGREVGANSYVYTWQWKLAVTERNWYLDVNRGRNVTAYQEIWPVEN